MQPYFLPYIGYFQLINAVDEFVIYDNIKFTKKGWINRNRILCNGKDEFITLPLKKASDFSNIIERSLSDDWEQHKIKLTNKINSNYQNSLNYKIISELMTEILNFNNKNLFYFIENSLKKILSFLNIETKIITSSNLDIDHSLKSENKVIAICNSLNADVYINPIGGVELYDKDNFKKSGLELKFLKTDEIKYEQLGNEFIPFLSILDVMMFNDLELIKNNLINKYSFV